MQNSDILIATVTSVIVRNEVMIGIIGCSAAKPLHDMNELYRKAITDFLAGKPYAEGLLKSVVRQAPPIPNFTDYPAIPASSSPS